MAFTIPSVFTAIDRMTRPVRAMADRVNSSVDAMEKKFKNLSDVSKKVMVGGAVVGAAIAAPIVYATKKAVEFEDKMADVAKVMNLNAGSKELAKVGEEVQGIALHLKRSTIETAELFANIAQSGVAAKDVGKVSKLAGEMGVAYGISADMAGASFVKLQNAMGVTLEQTKSITDAINHLGNNTAAKSSELLEFMAAGGAGAARNLDIIGEKAAAIGSVWISNGKSASEAGTIFERMMKGILGNAEKMKIFSKAGGGINGLTAIIEQGAKLKGQAQYKFFESFGQYGTDISMLSKNLDLLKKNLNLVGNAADYADSSHAEFANRQKTTAERLKGVQVQFEILAIKMGELFLPILEKIMDKVSPLIDRMAKWISENKETAKTIGMVALGVSAFAFALSGIAGVVQSVIVITKVWTAVQAALNITMMANPIGIIIGLIITLIGVIVWLKDNVKGWGEQWDEVWSFAKAVFLHQANMIKLGFLILADKFLSMVEVIKKAWYTLQNALGKMSDERYKKEISLIDAEKNARIGAMQETMKEMQKHGERIGQGVDWKLQLKDAPTTPAINPKAEQNKALSSTISETINNKLSIDINDKKGLASVGKNTGGIPIRLTPNIGTIG